MPDSQNFPTLTIGLTCFNAEKTVERALRSAQVQDWPALEILVVDDASSDDSWRRIEAVAAADPRIKAVRHAANSGAAAARNTILEQAAGTHVAFFDDDDESFPDRLRTQYEAICDYEARHGIQLVACYASGSRCYPNGYEVELDAIGSRPAVPAGETVADYLLFNGRKDGVFYGAGTPTCALMARVSTLRAAGGFDTELRRAEDVDFAIRLALIGGHFIGCKERLFLQHATFSADKSPDRNLASEMLLLEKHAAYLKQKGRYGYARRWFRLRFYHFSHQRARFILSVLALLLRHPVSGMAHLLRSVPRRMLHEKKMSRDTQ